MDWTWKSISHKISAIEEGRLKVLGAQDSKRAQVLDEILNGEIDFENKRVLILGTSPKPWLEAMVLAKKASKVTSIDITRVIALSHEKVIW